MNIRSDSIASSASLFEYLFTVLLSAMKIEAFELLIL